MEYIPFFALFGAWFVAMLNSVPEAPDTYEEEVCEIKEVVFGAKKKEARSDMRLAA
jgi:hypothetical protein